jgi:hypothetical protein
MANARHRAASASDRFHTAFSDRDILPAPQAYNVEMKFTRRAIARMLATTAAIPTVAPVVATPQAETSDPARPAREQFEKNTQQMAQVKVPMATEPPFHFKA